MKTPPFSQFPPVKPVNLRHTDTPAPRFALVALFATLLTLATTGCQVLRYESASGEKFTRSSLGTTTAISSLTVESGTNGFRRVHLHGYQSDGTQALGAITEAAVRGAVSAAKP
jgi:outer membrane lipoprotein SlyB